MGSIKLPIFVVYKNKNNIIMKTINTVAFTITAISIVVTFGGAVVILSNL